MDLLALINAKKYTDDSIEGTAGVIAGKNCTIDSITDITGGHRITFKWTADSGSSRTSTLDVMDGADGSDGTDGVSPTITITEITGGHTVTITDKNGDHSFNVMDGSKGEDGADGNGVKSATIDASNHLILTLDDDTEVDAGEIIMSVSNLTDIDIDDLEDGQILKYNGTTHKWENATAGSVDTNLSDLNDVNLSSLTDGQIIVWDATAGRWKNANNTATVTVDSALSDSSENPVQNKVVKAAIDGKVDVVSGKGLSSNDYTTEEKTKLSGIASGAEVNVQSDWNQSSNEADDYIKNKPTLGTAAAKDATDLVRPNSHDLVESGSVYNAIIEAVSSVYTPRGSKTCAELTSSLLIEANVGSCYNVTDSGSTTALFVQGAGQTINQGDTVGIIKAGATTYLFNLMGNTLDLHEYQKKELTDSITIGGTSRTTVEAALQALNTAKADSSALSSLQPQTLATPVTINGATKTTVQQALSAINQTITEISAEGDFNDYTASGVYTFSDSGNIDHAPRSDDAEGLLIVGGNDDDYIRQLYIQGRDGIYEREYYNSAWRSWVQIDNGLKQTETIVPANHEKYIKFCEMPLSTTETFNSASIILNTVIPGASSLQFQSTTMLLDISAGKANSSGQHFSISGFSTNDISTSSPDANYVRVRAYQNNTANKFEVYLVTTYSNLKFKTIVLNKSNNAVVFDGSNVTSVASPTGTSVYNSETGYGSSIVNLSALKRVTSSYSSGTDQIMTAGTINAYYAKKTDLNFRDKINSYINNCLPIGAITDWEEDYEYALDNEGQVYEVFFYKHLDPGIDDTGTNSFTLEIHISGFDEADPYFDRERTIIPFECSLFGCFDDDIRKRDKYRFDVDRVSMNVNKTAESGTLEIVSHRNNRGDEYNDFFGKLTFAFTSTRF